MKEMLDYCNDKFVTSKSFVQLVRSCFYLFTIQTCECHFKHLQDFWLLLRGNGSSMLEFFASKRITKQLFIPVVTVSHKSTGDVLLDSESWNGVLKMEQLGTSEISHLVYWNDYKASLWESIKLWPARNTLLLCSGIIYQGHMLQGT